MEKIRKISLLIITVIIVISTGFNIRNQFYTLNEAESKNDELKLQIEKTKVHKQKLIKQVEHATSSGFVDQQRKQLLGMGTENDVWLILPTKKEEIQYYTETNEYTSESNFKLWLNLFTR